MKAFKYLLLGLCTQGVFTGSVSAAPTSYVLSGTLDELTDHNDPASLAYVGAQPVYPGGIGAGTPFSMSVTLDGTLAALTGTLDFDIGGIYQGHLAVAGNSLLCATSDDSSCTFDYNDPLYGRLAYVGVEGQTTAATTNLPLSDLAGGWWLVSFALNISPNTPKPSADTLLSDLPLRVVAMTMTSNHYEDKKIPCAECNGGTTDLFVSQGWELSGLSPAVEEVPLPAAGWLFGSSVLGLARLHRRRVVR